MADAGQLRLCAVCVFAGSIAPFRRARVDPSSRIGTTLRGKWRIDRLLGTGGFAAVYAATHRAGKRVAVKVLHPALGASEDVRRRFLKEAYAANAVDHPGVVGVSDDDVTEDGSAFLVMDLLEGETVEARRKRGGGKLDVAAVLLVAEQVLDTLAAAHEKGIVHRDLKPENLFFTTAGQVRTLDFGIARFREPGDESTSTQTGLTMGSPAFMAPEQARGRWSEVDARTDLYAMGATMFTLLSGQLVHGKGNVNETLIAAATKPAPPLASIAPDVPQAVAAVVDRALSFEMGARWADARAMQKAVRAAKAMLVNAGTGTLPLGAAAGVPVPAAPWTETAAAHEAVSYTSTGTVALAASPRITEVIPPGGLPVSEVPAAAPITTSAPVVTTQAPAGKLRATPIAAAALVLVLGTGGVAVWLSTRAPTAAGTSVPVTISTASPTGEVVTASGPASALSVSSGVPVASSGGQAPAPGTEAPGDAPPRATTQTTPAKAVSGAAAGSSTSTIVLHAPKPSASAAADPLGMANRKGTPAPGDLNLNERNPGGAKKP
jgi:hypothetical protein